MIVFLSIISVKGGGFMNKKKIVGSSIIAVVFITFLIIGYNIQNSKNNMNASDMSVYKGDNYSDNKVEKSYNTDGEKESGIKKQIDAQIYGEIKKPGVYSLSDGTIVKDLIDKAGGFTENADCFSINGAKKLADGDDIEVKSKSQNSLKNGGLSVGSISPTTNGTSTNSENQKLDINRATEDDIINKKIPGIGKGLAEKIIKFRESNGGRINTEKDMETAIGPSRGKKIMDYVEIN